MKERGLVLPGGRRWVDLTEEEKEKVFLWLNKEFIPVILELVHELERLCEGQNEAT